MENKSKKRKKRVGNDTKQTPAKKKKREIDQFTEVRFKFELRDPNLTFSALEKFINQSEAWNPDSKEYDIVAGYCRSAPECTEILQLLDGGKRVAPELQKIFGALEAILVRIVDDLKKHAAVGKAILQKLLATSLQPVYFTLGSQNKSSIVKTTLGMLTALVMLGEQSAKALLTQLDVTHWNIKSLFFRRDPKSTHDVRTCLVHFLMSFLMLGSNSVIKQLISIKGFLNNIFEGIIYDKVANIQLILTTVLEKVVQNETVSKTQKLKLFNSHVLCQIGQLYHWTGQTKADEIRDDMIPSEDKETVTKVTHEFLLELCCSNKSGINFYDKSLGTAGKNQNQLLSSFLTSLTLVSESTEIQELICNTLRVCPDVLKHFLPTLIKSVTPRPSTRWCSVMDFLCKIYESQSDRPVVLKSQDRLSTSKVVEMVLVHLVPTPQIMTALHQAMKHNHPTVRYFGMKFATVLLHKSVIFLRCLQKICKELSHPVYTRQEMEEILSLYTESIVKTLPNCRLLMSCWNELLFSSTKGQSAEEDHDKNLKDQDQKAKLDKSSKELDEDICNIPIISAKDHMVKIEQALCFLQELSPSIFVDSPGDVSKLLEGLRMSQELSSPEQIEDELPTPGQSERMSILPQMYLLKLLAGTDARKLPWTQQSDHSLMYLLLEMMSKVGHTDRLSSVMQNLLCQLLYATGLFEDHFEELTLWIQHFSMSSKQENILIPMATMFTIFISNPMSFVDKLCVHMSKVMEMTDVETMDTDSIGTNESALDAILEMEEEEFLCESVDRSDVTTSGIRLPFTPLIIVALENLEKKELADKDFGNFLSGVIVDILHSQQEPVTMATLIDNHQEKVHPDVVCYVKSLLRENVQLKTIAPEVNFINRSVAWSLMKQYGNHDNREEMLTTITSSLELVNLGYVQLLVDQILLYTQIIVSRKRKKDVRILQFFWEILQKIVTTIPNITNEEEIPLRESHHEEEELMQVQTKSNNEILWSAIQRILRNPVVKESFLLRSKKTCILKISETVSSKLCDIVTMVTSVNEIRRGDITGVLQPYFDRCVHCIGDPGCHMLIKLFLNSTYEFMESSFFYDFLGVLLSAELNDLIDVNSQALTQLGEILVNHLMKAKEFNSNKLNTVNFARFQTLFQLLNHCFLDTFETACLDLLSSFPTAAVGVPREVFIQSLNSASPIRVNILSVILCHNNDARHWFVSWSRDICNFTTRQFPLVTKYLEVTSRFGTHNENTEREILKKVLIGLDTHLMEHYHRMKAGHVSAEDVPHVIFQLIGHLHKKQLIDDGMLVSVMNKTAEIMKDPTCISSAHIDILYMLCSNHDNAERRLFLFTACYSALHSCLKNAQHRQSVYVTRLINILMQTNIEDIKKFFTVGRKKEWPSVVKALLRHRYSDKETFQLLYTLTDCIYNSGNISQSKGIIEQDDQSHTLEQRANQSESVRQGIDQSELSITVLHEMIISHSLYLPVMFNESHPDVKEPLIDILTLLVELDSTCCQTQHIGILLGAYTASLSKTDQKILRLLSVYEKNKAAIQNYRPYMWGNKAVEIHSIKKSLGPSLFKQPTMEEVLDCLDQTNVRASILNCPIRRKMQPGMIQDAESCKSITGVYDPCFLLSVFSELLKSDAIVDCRKFIETNCLGFTFACLSCHDDVMRGAAYHVLTSFITHLHGAKFHEVQQILYLMETVKNSVEKPNAKLPCIITLFLAKMSFLLLKPEDHMYKMLNAFLLLKPALDVSNVPEFYKLFNSSVLEYKMERSWMLSLLSEGLRETADFHIFEKRHIFKMLLTFYESSISDNTTQLQVLKILHSASMERTVTSELVKNHGIVSWISVVVATRSLTASHFEMITEVLCNFWFTMQDKRHGHNKDDEIEKKHLPVLFRNEMDITLRSLLSIFREDLKPRTYCKYLETQLSILKHTAFTERKLQARENSSSTDDNSKPGSTSAGNSEEKSDSTCFPPWGLTDKLLLVRNACSYTSDKHYHNLVTTALKNLNYKKNDLVMNMKCKSSASKDLKTESLVELHHCKSLEKITWLTITILCWNPISCKHSSGDNYRKHHSVAMFFLSTWVLAQIKHLHDLPLIQRVVEWLHCIFYSRDDSRDIYFHDKEDLQKLVDGYLNLYSCLFDSDKEFRNHDQRERTDTTTEHLKDITVDLKKTLKKINEVVYQIYLFQQSGSQCSEEFSRLSCTYKEEFDEEEKSLTLRQYVIKNQPAYK